MQRPWRTLVAMAWLGSTPVLAQQIALPRLPQDPAPQVVIYYDGSQEVLSEGPLDARQVLNLLGHFSLRGEIVPLGNYQPGDLTRYQAGFFVGTTSGSRFPAGFLADVRGSSKPSRSGIQL